MQNHPDIQEMLDLFGFTQIKELAEKLEVPPPTVYTWNKEPEESRFVYCAHCNSVKVLLYRPKQRKPA